MIEVSSFGEKMKKEVLYFIRNMKVSTVILFMALPCRKMIRMLLQALTIKPLNCGILNKKGVLIQI